MMLLETIYKVAKEELAYAWDKVQQFLSFVYKYIASAFSMTWKKLCEWTSAVYEWCTSLSLATKVFSSMSLFLVFFLFWQFMAYIVSQPVFVMVNLLLVILSAAITCYIIFTTSAKVASLEKQVEEVENTRKKKDQEIVSLKREIHDLNIASRKQQSFGKNSQVLIDTVKKNRKAIVDGEPRGLFILKSLAQCADICCGIIYMKRDEDNAFVFAGEYATVGTLNDEPYKMVVTEDDAVLGQVIKTGKLTTISNMPAESLTIMSGLGKTDTINITVLPIKQNGNVVALAEVASFSKLAVADIWKDIDNVLLNE